MMLSYIGVDYEEATYYTTEDPASRESWLKGKFEHGMDFPNLPHFIDKKEDGNLVAITEHNAVQYYLADRYWPDLLGQSPQDRATADMMMNLIVQARGATTLPIYMNPNFKNEELQEVAQAKARIFSDFLRDKKFILGDSLCFADFSLYELICYFEFLCGKELLEYNPDLMDYVMRIEALP